jgi:branched-chain amino acid transport system permease protein
MTLWINTVLQGLLLGGLYALLAAGLSLSFGVMRQVNLAHGDLIVLAGFGAVAVVAPWAGQGRSWLPWLALLGMVPVMALAGYGLQRLLLNRALGRDLLAPVMITYGLSIVLQNALLMVFSADVRQLDASTLTTGSWRIADGVAVGWLPLLTFVLALAALLGLQMLFTHTRLGRRLRAVADDPEVAELMGLSHRHLYAVALAISGVLMALAGVLMVTRTAIGPFDGPARLLFAFEAVIIGGLGSLWGTLVGGLALGLAQAVGAAFDPGWGVLAGHLVFLAVLLVRPQGLFPKTRDQ